MSKSSFGLWSQPPVILKYGVAVLSVTAALIIARWMEIVLQSAPHVSLFLCAVMFSAWFGGIRPGLLAIALSLLALAYYFLPPIYSFSVETRQTPNLLLFAVSALFVGALSTAQKSAAESLRHARDVLDGTVKELKRSNEALQAENAQRKQAEKALSENEQLFRQLTENIREVFWMNTPSFDKVLYVSHAYESVWGRTCESLYQDPRSSIDAIHPEDRARVIAVTERDREQGFEVEYRVVRPDQSVRWIRNRGFPIKDKSGRFYRVAGIAEDITERQQAELALRRSEDRIRLIIDTIPTMAWSLRPDGAVDFLNQRWLDYTGLSLEEEIDQPTSPMHPEDLPRVMEKWLADMAAGGPSEDEMRLRRADGEYRWFLVRTAPLRDEQGNLVKWYGASIDIEDRKQAEEKLKSTSEQLRALSARLQSAREEEGIRLAREIHDELGSALTSLRWDLEGIEMICSEPVKRSQVAALRKRITAMLGLTDTTINIVRRIASELRPSGLDDLGLVVAIEWQAQQFQDRTGIVVHCDCLLGDVNFNREQSTAIFRIFQEALTNILRHAQATRVDVTLTEEDGLFVLTIRDNGRGITEDERFGQLSIGLLGMRERAHLIGGEIDITGAKGEGTVVTARLPIVPARRTFEAGT